MDGYTQIQSNEQADITKLLNTEITDSGVIQRGVTLNDIAQCSSNNTSGLGMTRYLNKALIFFATGTLLTDNKIGQLLSTCCKTKEVTFQGEQRFENKTAPPTDRLVTIDSLVKAATELKMSALKSASEGKPDSNLEKTAGAALDTLQNLTGLLPHSKTEDTTGILPGRGEITHKDRNNQKLSSTIDNLKSVRETNRIPVFRAELESLKKTDAATAGMIAEGGSEKIMNFFDEYKDDPIIPRDLLLSALKEIAEEVATNFNANRGVLTLDKEKAYEDLGDYLKNLTEEASCSKPFTTEKQETPPQFIPNSSDSTNDVRQKKQAHIKQLANNHAAIVETQIAQIPDIPLASDRPADVKFTQGILNNYGVILDEEPELIVSTDKEGKEVTTLTCLIDGKPLILSTENGHQTAFIGEYLEGERPVYDGDQPIEALKVSQYDPKERRFFISREAAIMCDVTAVVQTKGVTVSTLADGCGHGIRSRLAAQLVSEAVQEYMKEKLEAKLPKNTREMAELLNRAVTDAGKKLKQKGLERGVNRAGIGDSTLSASAIMGSYYVGTSVGDPRTYVIGMRNGERVCIPLADKNRDDSLDAADSGGRLSGNGTSDYRNLQTTVIKLEPGDKVIVCSDGVHDNLDPICLGISPSEAGLKGVEKWDLSNPDHVKARSEFMTNKLLEITKEAKTDEEMQSSIYKFVQESVKEAIINTFQKAKYSGTAEEEVKEKGKPDHVSTIILSYNG